MNAKMMRKQAWRDNPKLRRYMAGLWRFLRQKGVFIPLITFIGLLSVWFLILKWGLAELLGTILVAFVALVSIGITWFLADEIRKKLDDRQQHLESVFRSHFIVPYVRKSDPNYRLVALTVERILNNLAANLRKIERAEVSIIIEFDERSILTEATQTKLAIARNNTKIATKAYLDARWIAYTMGFKIPPSYRRK